MVYVILYYFIIFNRARNKRTRTRTRTRGLRNALRGSVGRSVGVLGVSEGGYSRKDIKARGGALKCDYGGLVLFRGVDRGQKKRQLQRHENRRSCFFVAGVA